MDPVLSAALDEEEALVYRLLPIADRIVRQYLRRMPDLTREDATSDAYLAVLLAVRSYKEEAGVPVEAWVAFKVRHAITDGIRSRLGATSGDEARDRARMMVKLPTTTLDDPIGGGNGAGGSNQTVAETVADKPHGDLDPFEHVDIRDAWKRAMPLLTPGQREVVTAYFIHGDTMAEIARRRGVTESAVSLLVRAALTKMGPAFGAVAGSRPRLNTDRAGTAKFRPRRRPKSA